MRSARDTSLLLVVERSVLRSSPFAPQAVMKGLVQKVVDMRAHGVALSDHQITEAETTVVMQDAQILSDEVRSYHGLIRYDTFVGNRAAFRAMMLDVSRRPSITFVYRVSGNSHSFTHLYFDNFYSKKMNEENLRSFMDRDLILPMEQQVGSKSFAIAMTLMAKRCPKDTVVTFQSGASCTETPLNLTLLCEMPAAYIQCHHHSAMTRHYGGDGEVTEDVFFELAETFSAKVHLIMTQLKQARISPAAFILERYDLESQSEIWYHDANQGIDVQCQASPFGFTKATKEKLSKFS